VRHPLPLIALLAVLFTACGGEAQPTADAAPADAEVADADVPAVEEVLLAPDVDPPDVEIDLPPVGPLPPESCVVFTPDGEDPSAALFDPDCVLDVHVEIHPDDWELLRKETRPLMDVVGEGCLEDPPSEVFDWYAAAVTVSGERVQSVAIRKKGFWGSLSTEKPALKIRLDAFVAGQELAGLRRLTLNNVIQDPSYLNACLAYGIMAEAGMPAPRCGFARVKVNQVDYGLYVHVDSIKKPFLARHFTSDGGNLYEATLSDFRPPFEDTWEKKTNKTEADWSDLAAATAALALPDEELMEAVGAVFDLDTFMTHWATEVLVGHWDGYAGNMNNAYVYAEPADGRFRFIPWGVDSAFVDGQPFIGGEGNLPDSVYAFGHLADRLYAHPEGRAAYVARLQQLVDTVWDADALVGEIDRMEALIAPHLSSEERDTVAGYLQAKRNWISHRPSQLAPELSEPPDWTYPARQSICWTTAGTVSGTFNTDWGSSGWDYLNKVGTLVHDMDGLAVLGNIASNARLGSGPTDGYAVVELIGSTVGGDFIVLVLFGDPELIAPNTSIPIDWLAMSGVIGRVQFLDMDFEIIGLLTEGVLHFEDASTFLGELVNGSFEAQVILPP
jgi:spore coat protein CotH